LCIRATDLPDSSLKIHESADDEVNTEKYQKYSNGMINHNQNLGLKIALQPAGNDNFGYVGGENGKKSTGKKSNGRI
jgi:hypothetical protein